MKHKLLISALFFFAFPFSVHAHTHLENSDPDEGESITSDDSVITLTFDSPVQEPNEITISEESGGETTIEDITHSTENVIEIPIPEDLEGGDINLFYSIVGEDGHVMEEELAYTYEEIEEENEKEENEGDYETESEDETTEDTEENNEVNESESEAAGEEESGSNSWLLPVIAAGLIAVAAIVFLFTRKKS
ncbi:copper resistance CopC family protein [Halobacillus sp. A5]|uniref:copper resistance CopC family protein n=1 Tax=Halobacillus sp. A5 TaxID=2880263 RepID=UPI0020A68891|nr:copper resistance CopC family protein [Halobacillus sp. A5]MCP3028129.1 copper resistance protein CopC [Halobacillus sp. A5]